MPLKSDPDMGINSWLEDELYHQYLHDRSTVDESWKHVFEKANGITPAPAAPATDAAPRARTASRRTASAAARRSRQDRREHGRQPRHSAGHLAAHHRRQGDGREPPHHQPAPHPARQEQGLLHAPHRLGHRQSRSKSYPALNNAYAEKDGQPYRIVRPEINLGIAVDVAGKDGARSLMVPNIKNAGALEFPGIPRPPSTTWWRAPAPANSPPPISRAPPFRSPIPAPSAPWPPTRG